MLNCQHSLLLKHLCLKCLLKSTFVALHGYPSQSEADIFEVEVTSCKADDYIPISQNHDRAESNKCG